MEHEANLAQRAAPAKRNWARRIRDLVAVAPEILLAVVSVAAIWLGVEMMLRQAQEDLLSSAARDSANLARSFEQGLDATFEAIDQALLFARASYARDPAGFDVAAWARDGTPQQRTAFQISLIGADGRLVSSTVGLPKVPLNVADRPYFKIPASSPVDEMHIGVPVIARDSGRLTVPFTRRINMADGSFGGIIVASVDPQELVRGYEEMSLSGRGMVALMGRDGIVRARAPAIPDVIGHDFSGSDTFQLALNGKTDTFEAVGSLQHVARLFSSRHMIRQPMLVLVALDKPAVLEPYEKLRQRVVTAALALSFGSLVIWFMLGRQKQRLVQSQAVLDTALSHMAQGIVMVDANGTIAVSNQRAADLLGVPFERLRPGRRPDAAPSSAKAEAPFEFGLTHGDRLRPDGAVVETTVRALLDGGVVRTYTDVTHRRRGEAQIRHAATHDMLTGLPNRMGFTLEVERVSGTAALFLVGLDGFKRMNDLAGRVTGDALLCEVAARLGTLRQQGDILARLGGDLFALLRPGAGTVESTLLARDCVDLMARPFTLEDRAFVLGASVGVAVGESLSLGSLLARVETALRNAKLEGRGTYRLHNTQMDAQLKDRKLLERDLREAIARDQLTLAYQPIRRISDGGVESFEALLRWNHPVRGAISPADFVPVAEQAGLISALTMWVMETACREAVNWPDPVRVAVNISPPQLLEGDLCDRVAAVLKTTGLPASRLDLEVTEGLSIENPAQAEAAVAALHAFGVRVSLDDFGTGHSSLDRLASLRFDKLKIDRCFVSGLETNPVSQAIVQAVLALGHGLGLQVVAEGVEDDAQMTMLRDMGCDLVQGYLTGRPMLATEAIQLLQCDSLRALGLSSP